MESVTDESGTSCHVIVAPDSPALTFDASKMDTTVEEMGFTEADAAAAQQATVTFVAEQSLDSAILDTYTADAAAAQYAENRERLIAPAGLELYDGYVADQGLEKGVVLTGNEFPALRRDGGPRAKSVSLDVVKIQAKELDGKPYIQVAVDARAAFPAGNTDMASFALAHPEQAGEEAQVRSSAPFLFDSPDGAGVMTVSGVFSVAYFQGAFDRFAGTTTDWSATFADS